MIGKEEAATHADATEILTAPQVIENNADEGNYNGHKSESDGIAIEIFDGAEEEATSKPTKDEASLDIKAGEEKEADADQTKGSDDKKSAAKHENRSSSGSHDRLVSLNPDVLAESQRTKYPEDKISIQLVHRTR